MSEPTEAEIKFDNKEADWRAQILGSDLYSPMVKRVMQRFWARCDELAAARVRANPNQTGEKDER